MKCNKCLDTVTTVRQVRDCRTCSTDGTANEIPKDMNNDDKLALALQRKPGLAARFLSDRSDPPGPDSPQGRNPAPGVNPAYDRDRINALERREREHTITPPESKELSELRVIYPVGKDFPQGRHPTDRINALELRERERTITHAEQRELNELRTLSRTTYPAGTAAQTWTVSVSGTKSQARAGAIEQSDRNITAGLMTRQHKAEILKAIDEAPGQRYAGSFGGTLGNPGIGES